VSRFAIIFLVLSDKQHKQWLCFRVALPCTLTQIQYERVDDWEIYMNKIECKNVWKIFGPKADGLRSEGVLSRASLEEAGHVVAVQDASFEVKKGEIFVIMGLSGSGKSTLIRCLSRLIEASSGQVLIDGQDILEMSDEALRELRRHRLSMVFQHFGLFAHRKVIDNVAYGLEIQGVNEKTRHARALEVLKVVGLQGWEHRYPNQLSGGMQQRVGIARALAVNPEILMFDEPFSALDPLIRRELQDELLNLQKQMQKTILFITHDFLEAVKLGDRIAIMKDGQIVQIGTPIDIVLNPANDYVKAFIKDVPKVNVLTAATVMSDRAIVNTRDLNQDTKERLESQRISSVFIKNEQGRCLGQLPVNSLGVGDMTTHLQPVTNVVSPSTKLGSLLGRLAKSDIPLPVMENDVLLGTVDSKQAMMVLANE
jgi:glycine betaine/proline transport system ATP-binding protein